MGKLAMGLNPLSKYFGENAVEPDENELCYDEETGDIHVWKKINGVWQHFSRTAQIQAFLDNMEASGVFQSSAAFVQNRKIHRFYFDIENGVVRLDPDLVFDPSYRYYAIRDIDADAESGAYSYITGVAGSTSTGGNVIASLVDMEIKDSEAGDGTQVAIPGVGGLVKECTNGNSYIVEFYNANRQLINFDTYEAIKVRTAETDLCPDTAITDMAVSANQSDGEDFFLYQGQDVDSLEIETRMRYGDSLWKDVSHEEVNGGRLVIQGLDELDTSTITATGAEPQTIDIIYQMVRSNTSFKSESAYYTDNGAIISPASLTIRMTKKVRIVQNPNVSLEEVIPAPYFNNEVDEMGLPVERIRFKYFAYYSNGTIHDITNMVSYQTAVSSDADSGTYTVTIVYPKGNLGQTGNKTFSVTVDRVNKILRIGNQTTTKFVEFDPTQTSGNQYSGKFVAIRSGTTLNTSATVGAEAALAFDGANLGNSSDVRAVRYRDVIDSNYYYTDTYASPASPVYYKLTGNHALENNRPILVEYLSTQSDNNDNIISSRVVGAVVHYAVKTGSSSV